MALSELVYTNHTPFSKTNLGDYKSCDDSEMLDIVFREMNAQPFFIIPGKLRFEKYRFLEISSEHKISEVVLKVSFLEASESSTS